MKAVINFIKEYLHWFVVGGVALLAVLFLTFGHLSENGKYITLDGSDAYIPEATKKFVEDAEAAMFRLMNEDKPSENADSYEVTEADGQGAATSLDQVLGRRKPDGDKDGGNGWQCSKYTAYLATGKKDYSSRNPDYGPVHGKNLAKWLVDNYGWKYTDTPVAGAIGSGGFNTTYGHTAMFLYWTGANTAMVNDANYVPLTVATHNMNVSGWVWVVPGDYTPTPDPTPTPSPTPTPTPVSGKVNHTVVAGETLGQIIRNTGYAGSRLFGDSGLAQRVADDNNIANRGLIYPKQLIVINTELFSQY